MARFALSGTSLESRLGGFVYVNESLFKPQDDRFYCVNTSWNHRPLSPLVFSDVS